MTHPNRLPPATTHSFQRSLPSYHAASVAQAQIADALVQALQWSGAPTRFARVFEFGCGTGHLTSHLLHQFSIRDLSLNDLLPDCVAALQPILHRYSATANFYPGAIETLDLPTGLDLIASASTVQWVDDPASLMLRLSGYLAPGGWLALSGFGTGHFAELRSVGGFGKAPSYLDPVDWQRILPSNLHILALQSQPITLQFPDALSLLRHLRQTGVNAPASRVWTRADLAAFDARLRQGLPKDSDLTLTYCPVILIARKPL
jgi:malonyl-CoA O-methyltransferase